MQKLGYCATTRKEDVKAARSRVVAIHSYVRATSEIFLLTKLLRKRDQFSSPLLLLPLSLPLFRKATLSLPIKVGLKIDAGLQTRNILIRKGNMEKERKEWILLRKLSEREQLSVWQTESTGKRSWNGHSRILLSGQLELS